MAELIIALLAWIGVQTGLTVPPLPAFVLLPQEQMSERAFGRKWQPGDDLRAFYDRSAATVYLRSDWSASDLRSRATLLHELVHHVQAFNRTPSECPESREPLAYELTLTWLRQQGAMDPLEVLGVDEFSIYALSPCRDPG